MPGPLERAQWAQRYFHHIRLGRAARGAGAIQGGGEQGSACPRKSFSHSADGVGTKRPSSGLLVPQTLTPTEDVSRAVLGNCTRQLVLPLKEAPRNSVTLSPPWRPCLLPAFLRRCFQPFPPSSDLGGVSGRSHRSLQGGYLWGQQWGGGLPFPDNSLVLSIF